MNYGYIADLVSLATERKQQLSDIVLATETANSDYPTAYFWEAMRERYGVMKEAAVSGLKLREKSASGMVGGDAAMLAGGDLFLGPVVTKTAAYSIAISEVNASMGRIVACPTAGSCGIVPGAILAVCECLDYPEKAAIRALFTAAGIGEVVAKNATVAGAVGGCQAECGTAAAMAAAAVVELRGGTAYQSAQAVALALKNMLGLVCDPVAGLVEVPCVKRNGFAAVHALLAAQLALSGVESVIPADEVIAAMYRIGLDLPSSLKETSEGGLAKTPTGQKINERLLI